MREKRKVYHLRPHMGPVKVSEDCTCQIYVYMVHEPTKAKKAGQAVIRLAASVWVTAATYMWLAPLAFMERGYQAYGGECLAAAMAGMASYFILRR